MNDQKFWIGIRTNRRQWAMYPVGIMDHWFLSAHKLDIEVYDAYVDALIMGMAHEAAVEVALKLV